MNYYKDQLNRLIKQNYKKEIDTKNFIIQVNILLYSMNQTRNIYIYLYKSIMIRLFKKNYPDEVILKFH